MIYLDYNATTPLAEEALEAMLPWLRAGGLAHGNPSSIHASGRKARAAIDESRDRLAALLGAKSHEIIFTSGGTESNNLAILGLAERFPHKKHLVTVATEHHAVLHPMQYLAEQRGYELSLLPVDRDGLVAMNDLEQVLRPDTLVVSIMHANNETGVIQPIEHFSSILHQKEIFFHSDAIQSFGKIRVMPYQLGVDLLSLAAHKFYGPKGVGALWVRSGVSLRGVYHGGAQENQRRPGTENVAAIVGMVCAAELASKRVEEGQEQAKLYHLREELWQGVASIYPAAIRHTPDHGALANTLDISFPDYDGEMLLISLDLAGISLSSGSACMVGSLQPSHVLEAMGVDRKLARNAIRFSLGKETKMADIERTIEALRSVLAQFS